MTGGVDGYPFVQKALAIDPESAEMHFAAAVMASSPPRPADREQHLRRARAAKNDSLLAQNLNTHFQ
jgi:predicted glycosyltransferase